MSDAKLNANSAQRYLRMTHNHVIIAQQSHSKSRVLAYRLWTAPMSGSVKLLPGSTVRWRGRLYLIVDYESLEAMIARQPHKRTLERIPVKEVAPDHQSHGVSAPTPNLVSVPDDDWQISDTEIRDPQAHHQHGQIGANVRSRQEGCSFPGQASRHNLSMDRKLRTL